ncbi:hypothetical protein [Calidifontibacillus erzurumensis]|uniref:Uncharacterized protein n=1 Tax=Calidifontibacillus erzurumensis TaxID=2741433 RepID=A0A8J8GD36_9BACI|nr:hypothetical protein [Calidifontibacillus erzurumensis]NSL51705.1 hypothetical protein [Calidifontibacillus erzurumensis]
MTLKFDLLEKYLEQKQAIADAMQELIEREEKAKAEVELLKAKYEETLKESVTSGKDKTAELDKLAEQIEEAKKIAQHRREERYMYSALRPLEKIKGEDLVHAWNNEFIPLFKEKRFNAVLDRLLKAKREYAEAELDYYKAVDEFESILSDVRSEVGNEYYYKFKNVKFSSTTQRDKYLLTSSDLYDLGKKEMPRSISYGGNE